MLDEPIIAAFHEAVTARTSRGLDISEIKNQPSISLGKLSQCCDLPGLKEFPTIPFAKSNPGRLSGAR